MGSKGQGKPTDVACQVGVQATHQRTGSEPRAPPGRGEGREGRSGSPRRRERPDPLAIDIGGTGLKASVLDATGAMVAKRVRVADDLPDAPDGRGRDGPDADQAASPRSPVPTGCRPGSRAWSRRGRILSAPALRHQDWDRVRRSTPSS